MELDQGASIDDGGLDGEAGGAGVAAGCSTAAFLNRDARFPAGVVLALTCECCLRLIFQAGHVCSMHIPPSSFTIE